MLAFKRSSQKSFYRLSDRECQRVVACNHKLNYDHFTDYQTANTEEILVSFLVQ